MWKAAPCDTVRFPLLLKFLNSAIFCQNQPKCPQKDWKERGPVGGQSIPRLQGSKGFGRSNHSPKFPKGDSPGHPSSQVNAMYMANRIHLESTTCHYKGPATNGQNLRLKGCPRLAGGPGEAAGNMTAAWQSDRRVKGRRR